MCACAHATDTYSRRTDNHAIERVLLFYSKMEKIFFNFSFYGRLTEDGHHAHIQIANFGKKEARRRDRKNATSFAKDDLINYLQTLSSSLPVPLSPFSFDDRQKKYIVKQFFALVIIYITHFNQVLIVTSYY